MLRIIVLLLALFAVGCNEKNDDKKGGDDSNGNISQNGVQGTVLYGGFDGQTDYSLLLPSFRTYSMLSTDGTAKFEKEEFTLTQEAIDKLSASFSESYPEVGIDRFKERLAQPQEAYRLTPAHAGSVQLSAARGGGRNQSWGAGETITVVFTQYNANQLAAGEQRYSNGAGGNLKACKSCHGSGEDGAPPHELGRVMEISDEQVIEWVTTGQVGTRKAKIQHTWEFNNEAEKEGIVAYLRSKQTNDVETLARLNIENMIANGGLPGGGGQRGGTQSANASASGLR